MLSYHSHTHLIINDLQRFLVADDYMNRAIPRRMTYKLERQRCELFLYSGVPGSKEFPGSEHE